MHAGDIFELLRDGRPWTRAELADATGLARSTIAARIDVLMRLELVAPFGGARSTGGRPPALFALNPAARVVVGVDVGATHVRAAIADLSGDILGEVSTSLDIAEGPEVVLGWVSSTVRALLKAQRRPVKHLAAIGMGLPGPVEHATGRPISPPIMPGWDRYDVPGRLQREYAVPVLVDNDVNIMALGEHWSHWRDTDHLLFIKVGTGIGCGIVAGRLIHRGAQGAAGDIGHIRVPGNEEILCRCGNVGCLEAVAGGRALADQLTALGLEAHNSRDVVRLVRAGEPQAARMVREAGRSLGRVLAGSVNFFNPAVIILGGDLGEAHEQLLAGVREVIFERSLPLATRDLRTEPSRLGDRAGVVGAAIMVIEHVLAPDVVDRALQSGIAAA